jgi:hypothetical protein
MTCHHSSGAQHRARSTPELNGKSHAFTRTDSIAGEDALTAFFAGCSTTSLLGAFRTRSVELICFASGVFKKS